MRTDIYEFTRTIIDPETNEIIAQFGLIFKVRQKVEVNIKSEPNTSLRRLSDEIKKLKGGSE